MFNFQITKLLIRVSISDTTKPENFSKNGIARNSPDNLIVIFDTCIWQILIDLIVAHYKVVPIEKKNLDIVGKNTWS